MFGQVANTACEREQATSAGRGVFPEPADLVRGQQRTDGDITLRTDEKVGELEPEESGQGKTVSCPVMVRIVRGFTKLQESLVTGRERHQATIPFG